MAKTRNKAEILAPVMMTMTAEMEPLPTPAAEVERFGRALSDGERAALEVGKPAPQRYRVTLNALSPIPHRELEVEAASEGEAWQRFCALNGISGSDCERTIEPLA